MLVFVKPRLVVFSTPKTGSTALEKALAPVADIVLQGDPQIKHCTFHRYKWRFEKFLEIFDKVPPETCAVIRHPQDWLGSWYRYRHGAWLDGTLHSTRHLSFDQFVEAYLAPDQPPCAAVGSQARFLTHPKTQATVDHLYRYDALPAFQDFVQTRIGHRFDLAQVNVSTAMQLSLSPRLARALQEHCALDFALYDSAKGRAAPSRLRRLFRTLAN